MRLRLVVAMILVLLDGYVHAVTQEPSSQSTVVAVRVTDGSGQGCRRYAFPSPPLISARSN